MKNSPCPPKAPGSDGNDEIAAVWCGRDCDRSTDSWNQGCQWLRGVLEGEVEVHPLERKKEDILKGRSSGRQHRGLLCSYFL